MKVITVKKSLLGNYFLPLKDLIFIEDRITQIHNLVEKNQNKMRELNWVESVFELDFLDSMANFLHSFARVHPFEDGNKRTAFVCVDAFLRLNKFKLDIKAEKDKTTEEEKFFWQNSNQQKTAKEIREFIKEHLAPCKKPKSVEQAIKDSIKENRQLLENLAK